MKSLLIAVFAAAALFATDGFAQNSFGLTPKNDFGFINFDGSLRPGERPYLTIGDFQRGLAYNPATDHIILVDRAAGSASNPNISGGIYVLAGATGEDVRTLSTNGMGGGNFADLAVAVDDAGVIYVGNMVNDGTTTPFKLYRWLSEESGEDPVVIYSGDPGNGRLQRWGDTMDIRGSGATTQIILGSRTSGAAIGTNVAILTTSDGGATFTPTTLALDVTDSASGGGIAFGAGNTFWAKNLDVPLRQFSFNLGTGQATTLRSYGTDSLPASRTLEALAVDTANNLMAIIDVPVGLDKVRLYDISNPASPPSLLAIQDFLVDNPNGGTTKAYLDFGGGSLYAHSMNNGLFALLVQSAPTPAPTIVSQPSAQRILAGRTLRLEVLAYPAATYQWQRSGFNIPGATGAILTISNAQPSQAGTYRVIVSNAGGSLTSSEVAVSIVNPEDLFHLEPLWSAAPGDAARPYVTSTGGGPTPNERNIAYNPALNQLYVQQKGASATTFNVHVIDAANGTVLHRLNTNGIFLNVPGFGGATGIGIDGIDVGDDGAIYACNMTADACGCANANGVFRVYRWANSDATALPVQVFQGDPAGQSASFRWGDVLDARGSGLGTQLIFDNHNTSARFMAILRPMDETMNSFVSSFFTQDITTPFGGSIGRSLAFGAGDTFWQKRKGSPLLRSAFDLNAGASSLLNTHTNFPLAMGPVGLDLSRSILAGLVSNANTTLPDRLDLYDISDFANPLLLAQYNFPVAHQPNNHGIGRVVFSGDKVFALNANNGLLAFRIVSGPVSPPNILQQPQGLRLIAGNSGSLRVITADIATFQWQRGGTNIPGATSATYMIANAQLSDAGTYRAIVSNEAGSTTSSNAIVTILPLENFHRLSPLWNAAPAAQPYVTSTGGGSTPNERNIAYNALSNQLYVVQKKSGINFDVHVVNADDGSALHTLNTNGIEMNVPNFGGSTGIGIDGIDVAADGAIYACNMTADACGCANPVGVFRVYRWANSDGSTVPVQVFAGEPTGQPTSMRWGDVLSARGGDTTTEIVIDNNQGTFAAVLKPTDGTMSAFASFPFSHAAGSGFIGRSLQFGSGDTIWQKRKGGSLQLSAYNLPGQTSAPVTNYGNFPASFGPVAVDVNRNLLAGINFSTVTSAPDTVDLYDISDFNNPLLIRKYAFPENSRANANFIGRVLLTGNRVFAINGNNGIVAFNILAPSGPPLAISRSGADVILSWAAPATDYVLQSTTSLSPAGWTAVSGTPVLNGNTYTLSESASTGNKFYRLCKDCP